MEKIRAIRGMNDVLPRESYKWEWIETRIKSWVSSFGYRNIRTPVVESTNLFVRSIGAATDIVEKEMYTFTDSLNGDSLTLRPEGTASVVRSALEHNLTYGNPSRLYYFGPMFRHERPQKGRFRQFNQVGVEALGFEGPDIDAEHVMMTAKLWEQLDISSDSLQLEINTLGSEKERVRYRQALVEFLKKNWNDLDEDSQRRVDANPLRVLDSKNAGTQELLTLAPKLMDHLSDSTLAKFDRFKAMLKNIGIDFTVNSSLVRGLDYYNDVVYEWKTEFLGAQGTVCAGGRYDGLSEQIGGKKIHSCGFALGVERLLSLLENNAIEIPEVTPDIYVVHIGEQAEAYALNTSVTLRDKGFRVLLHCGGGSLKAQMKKADASAARFAVIIGDREVERRTVSLKPLRDGEAATQDQQELNIEDCLEILLKGN